MIEVYTKRSYDEPLVPQLAVFLHNRVGALADVLRRFHKENTVLHALSITDAVDHAVVRLVADDTEKAQKILRGMDLVSAVSQVLAVEIAEDETGLLQICQTLIRGEVNIHYAYPMLTRPTGRCVVIVSIDDLGVGIDVLRNSQFRLLDEDDLKTTR